MMTMNTTMLNDVRMDTLKKLYHNIRIAYNLELDEDVKAGICVALNIVGDVIDELD